MKHLLGRSVQILNKIRCQPNFSSVFFSTIKSVPDKYWTYKFTNEARMPKQKYDYFFILDFEATCDNVEKLEPQEIIELPCLRLNTNTLEVDSAFHEFIRPVAHPELTPFCIQLTGIMQETLDQAQTFDQVWSNFLRWLEKNKEDRSSIFITSGHWDLQYMLPQQLKYSQISTTDDFQRWIDLKKAFAKGYGRFPFGIKDMLKSLNLPHLGKLHSGMDDCVNIVNIVKKMMDDKIVLDKTDYLKDQR